MDKPLKPLTPLGDYTPKTITIGGVTITETITTALASLAIRKGQDVAVKTAAAALGLTLPEPGHATTSTPYSAVWLGPDQWMILAPYDTHEDIAAHLETAFGPAASITEQTDAWVRFDLTGPTQPIFQRLCNLDTHAMPILGATRTVIDHLGTYILRLTETDFTILGPRSSAASLHHAVITAATSVL